MSSLPLSTTAGFLAGATHTSRAILSAIHDLEETNEEVDSVHVEIERVAEGVETLLRLGLVDDSLGVVHGQSSSKTESSPKPEAVEELRLRVHRTSDSDGHHSHAAHHERATPVQELLAGSTVGNCGE